jgi:creatinine amidohydrolase
VRLADLRSPQLADLLARGATVALLPVGAVEPHGPHAPLGTDTLISEGICRRAAAALAGDAEVGLVAERIARRGADAPAREAAVRAVVAPALPYGVTRYGAAFPGAVGVSEATLEALATEVCAALLGQGARGVVIVNSHFEPEQVATLRRVAAAQANVRLLDLTRRANAARLTPEFRDGSCHAGRYETSLVLADAPALVDRERMAGLPAVPVDMPAAMAAGATDFVAMGMTDAYCGAPADATAQEGEATYATLTAMLVEVVRELAC